MTKRRILLFSLCLLLICAALPLSACSPVEDSQQARLIGEEWMEYLMASDEDSAYRMVADICTREEFSGLWEYMRDIVTESTHYDMTQTNWNWKSENGIARSTVTFEIRTDDSKVFYLDVMTQEGLTGLAGLYCTDATGFAQSASRLYLWNILAVPLSLAAFALVILMLIDCAKRPLKNKVLWLLIILVWIRFAVSTGNGAFNFDFSFRFPCTFSELRLDLDLQNVIVRLAIPIGAIIYFFKRKTLALKDVPPPEENAEEPEITE